jgi:hypothetical protein
LVIGRSTFRHVLHPKRRQFIEHQLGHLRLVGKSRWWPLAVVAAGYINSTRCRRDGRVFQLRHEGGARGEGGRRGRAWARSGKLSTARAPLMLNVETSCARGHLRRWEGAEPDARLLARLPDLRHPLPPRTHPHAAVRGDLDVLLLLPGARTWRRWPS